MSAQHDGMLTASPPPSTSTSLNGLMPSRKADLGTLQHGRAALVTLKRADQVPSGRTRRWLTRGATEHVQRLSALLHDQVGDAFCDDRVLNGIDEVFEHVVGRHVPDARVGQLDN